MKTLFIVLSLTITVDICYGQSHNEKTVYSMKKDTPVIREEKSEIKMDAIEQQSRTSISMYKNSKSSDTKEIINQNPVKKEGGGENMLKSKPKDNIDNK